MLREADKVDIVHKGLIDLHDAEPDSERFTPAEIGRSAFQHHPRYDTAQAEAGKLPRFLRNPSIMGRLLGRLVDSGQVVGEFLKEDGSVLDMQEYRDTPAPKPSLDFRDKSYRLLSPVVEEPLTTEVITQNGNGSGPASGAEEFEDASGVYAGGGGGPRSRLASEPRHTDEPAGPPLM